MLQQQGHLNDALTWLKQATDLKPADATFWEYLADLHGDREEPAEAIPCWERVLTLRPKMHPRTMALAGPCKTKVGR